MAINKKTALGLAACVLAGSIAGSTLTKHNLTKKNSILDGTVLEDSCVVVLDDGSKDIARLVEICNVGNRFYESVISGQHFTDENSYTYCYSRWSGSCRHHVVNAFEFYTIEKVEPLLNYLTADELTKVMQGELDNNDINTIISRVIEPTHGNSLTKTR